MNSKPWPSPVRNGSGPDEAPANDPIRTLVARLWSTLLDLATGIVMARKGGDPGSARKMLGLLTVEEL